MPAAVLETLGRLVAYPTVSNRPVTELAAYVAQRLEDVGLRVVEHPDPTDPGKCNLVARAGPRGTDGLVISGHLDVVPTEGQPWTTDPFRLTERDGRLHGRGTADMKGFLAAVLHALDGLDTSRLSRELVCVWTHDEEVGCLGSARLATELAASGDSLPSACWIGEPTEERVLRMHPGHVSVEIAVTGRAAHSSRPSLGVNAIEGAARVVEIVRSFARELRAETAFEDLLDTPWVTLNVGHIEGGTAVNIVPDRCSLRLGYRPLPGTVPGAVHARLAARLAEADLGEATVSTRMLLVTPSLLTAPGTPLESLLSAHARIPTCGAAPFATDGGNLARLGTHPLIFGPGSIEVAHRADEYLEASALLRCVDVARRVIHTRCA